MVLEFKKTSFVTEDNISPFLSLALMMRDTCDTAIFSFSCNRHDTLFRLSCHTFSMALAQAKQVCAL